jgi:hypothetical protein
LSERAKSVKMSTYTGGSVDPHRMERRWKELTEEKYGKNPLY